MLFHLYLEKYYFRLTRFRCFCTIFQFSHDPLIFLDRDVQCAMVHQLTTDNIYN